MAKRWLSDISQVAEIIAAIAVVVSLVYVGQEVKRNTAAIQGASLQAIATSDSETLLTVAADASLSEVIRLGHDDPDLLNQSEKFRYTLFMRNFWLSFQNIYQQRELQLLDETVWQSYLTVICGMKSRTGVQKTWPEHSHILEDKFVATVEQCGSTPL
jgi:hypothetical protein